MYKFILLLCNKPKCNDAGCTLLSDVLLILSAHRGSRQNFCCQFLHTVWPMEHRLVPPLETHGRIGKAVSFAVLSLKTLTMPACRPQSTPHLTQSPQMLNSFQLFQNVFWSLALQSKSHVTNYQLSTILRTTILGCTFLLLANRFL